MEQSDQNQKPRRDIFDDNWTEEQPLRWPNDPRGAPVTPTDRYRHPWQKDQRRRND